MTEETAANVSCGPAFSTSVANFVVNLFFQNLV